MPRYIVPVEFTVEAEDAELAEKIAQYGLRFGCGLADFALSYSIDTPELDEDEVMAELDEQETHNMEA